MSKKILYRFANGLLDWPEEWTERRYNACNDPCDVLIGPCACGAWHHPEDWVELLNRYNAEIRDCPLNVTPEYVI